MVDIIPVVRFSKTSGGAQEKTRLLLTRSLIRDKQCCDENRSKNIYRGLDRGDFALGVFFAGSSALDSGSRSSTSPLAISIMSLASWARSRGRLSRFAGIGATMRQVSTRFQSLAIKAIQKSPLPRKIIARRQRRRRRDCDNCDFHLISFLARK